MLHSRNRRQAQDDEQDITQVTNMLFDYLDYTKSGVAQKIPTGAPLNARFDRIAINFWEEHCVECGAPECYETCDKFERNPFGRCRRLTYGIARCGKVGAAQVRFKEWGKLELRCTGWTAPYWVVKAAAFVDYHITPVVRLLGVSKWYYSFRSKALYRFANKRQQPNRWRFSFYNDKPVNLVAAVVQDDIGDVLSAKISVAPGWHEFDYKLPAIAGSSHFRISSITGTECDVIFSEMNVGIVREKSKGTAFAPFVKCVAWDLDNTLWKGVLANDGPEGIRLRSEIIDAVKTLDSRGILNTICSKNDYDCAWTKLKELGIHEYFVFPQINWNPKSENLKKAAKEINIGIDTFAFVDDSAHERGEVEEHLPMVRIFKETEIAKLLADKAFNPPVSDEGSKRRLSYLAEMSRRKNEESFTGDHDAFLRSCEIVLTLEPLHDDSTKKRCWELVNRTNQLTLAARRYSEESFAALLSRPKVTCHAIRCKDKYGDYGIVGFIATLWQEYECEVLEFVMSCRVAMKKCEFATIDYISEMAQAKGANRLIADVVETGRNKALVRAFDEMPGVEKLTTKDGLRYVIEFASRNRPEIPVKVLP